jgi:hypothetical protein
MHAGTHALGKALSVGRVEAKLDGGRHLVDVLPAGTGRADERLLEVTRMDDGFA